MLRRKNVQAHLKKLPLGLFVLLGILKMSIGWAQVGSRFPVPENLAGNVDYHINGVRLAQTRFPAWTGVGKKVSVKEDRPDTSDIDLRSRYRYSSFSSSLVNGHTTLMSTIIAGAGNSAERYRGVAPAALLGSANFSNLMPEPLNYYVSEGITVQNHSYGVGIEPFYGADAAAYDATALSVPELLHVFSSGNRGSASADSGIYKGIAGFANLTGSFKMAKNALTVGAIDSGGRIESQSSRGPSHDGRVKPDLVAFGEDGSSGAAALVSGTALLLQQAYQQKKGMTLPNALCRALLINSAMDLGNPGPDHTHGFGNLNAYAALKTVDEGRFHSDSLISPSEKSHQVFVPADIKLLKLTLVWNDLPAMANATKALIQDLNLELVHMASGQRWKPWVLSAFPLKDSLQLPAKRAIDTLNNVEQITIADPLPGAYEVLVSASGLQSSQRFHLAWQMEQSGQFEWASPLADENLQPNEKLMLRWFAGSDAQTGNLDYSLDSGATWLRSASNINLTDGYLSWIVPQANGKVLLRMQTAQGFFNTDTAYIHETHIVSVGASCLDSFLLYWNPVPLASGYRVYRLGAAYMEPLMDLRATSQLFAVQQFPEHFVAIAPLFNNREAARSISIDHSTQGVGCYIRNFLVSGESAKGKLLLTLGSNYGMREIVLEKWDKNIYRMLAEINQPNALEYRFEDTRLIPGTNRYRIRIIFDNGSIYFSEPEDLFYTGNEGYRIFPNPQSAGQSIWLAFEDSFDEGVVQILSAQGQLISTFELGISPQALPTKGLLKGIYFIRILRQGRVAWTAACIIR